jgi:hypothetical protein
VSVKSTSPAAAGIPQIDYDAPLTDADRQMLLDHGWEISEDDSEARLYSEEWSSIQAAVFSTKWWIEDCK